MEAWKSPTAQLGKVPGLGEQGGPGRLQAALPSLSLSRDLPAPPSSLQLPSAQQKMDGLRMSPQAAQHPGETWAGAGISQAGPHLLPAAVAELPNGGIDRAQGLPSSQVQKVKGVIKPRKGLWVLKTKGGRLAKHPGHCQAPAPPSGCSAGVPKATSQHARAMLPTHCSPHRMCCGAMTTEVWLCPACW